MKKIMFIRECFLCLRGGGTLLIEAGTVGKLMSESERGVVELNCGIVLEGVEDFFFAPLKSQLNIKVAMQNPQR